MKSINTCSEDRFSQLIPAIEAVCLAKAGEVIEIIMDDEQAFVDVKRYLVEKQIGFREIYSNGLLTLQFTKNTWITD